MVLFLNHLIRVVNVHWGGGKHFLYSGADGMFGSKDGQTWTPAEAAVPAMSLAWIDGVWIAAGEEQCWRSEDGAITWTGISVGLTEVVAARPAGAEQGVFVGWAGNNASENHIVYASHDLGLSWSPVLTIPTTVAENGYEFIRSVSGCGGKFFVCTIRGLTATHNGDGMIYSSSDGFSFTSARVFGPGTDFPTPPVGHRKGYVATAVAFDGDKYIALGTKEEHPTEGLHDSFIIYSESTTGTFAESEGTVAVSASQETPGGGESISAALSAAGGDGQCATGFRFFHYTPEGETSGELKVCFIPDEGTIVETMGSPPEGSIGSFCFKDSAVQDENTAGTPGIFACVAFGSDGVGGVYVASSQSETSGTPDFTKTHTGAGPTGAVAVGRVGFL